MDGLDDKPFQGVFRGKRVLVTGHTGFKGTWLSIWLARLGADVYGYSLPPPTEPSLFDAAGAESIIAHHQIGDIRDGAALKQAMAHARPDFVFHLAAQPLVRRSYREPVETYEVNVLGTVNLLEAVRSTDSVRVCQVITSDKCYENREWVYGYRENDPMGGYDPYSSSKGCAELVVSSYCRSYFAAGMRASNPFSLASVRAGNVIGGGDWAEDRIVVDCVRSLSSGKPALIRNPNAIRPWQHVLEPLSGYLSLAARQWQEPAHFMGGWNFGPRGSSCVNVGRLADLIVAEWGDGRWESAMTSTGGGARAEAAGTTTEPRTSQEPHEANFLKLDITKAETLLHWSPAFSVEEAVRETVKWYKDYYDGGEGGRSGPQMLDEQIGIYQAKARQLGLSWASDGAASQAERQ